jgi:hypothetical protein
LISREETQYDIIVKNQGNALEVLAELINQKMSLQVNPLMLAPVLQRLLSLKKETIAQRKAKLLGGKAVSFVFNGLKISEHNE